MHGSIARRLKKLEAALKPAVMPMPHVLEVRHGETWVQARARFAEQWGPIPRNHKFLVVPAKPRTPEENAAFEARFYEHQTALVADARSRRPTEQLN